MMHGKSIAARKPACGAHRHGERRGDFFGADVESMSPGARVAVALSVIVPVALSGVFLLAFFPGVWWIFTIYGWVVFPAFGLFASGVAGASGLPVRDGRRPSAVSGERQLLDALRSHGKLSAVGAASETSLTVAEAERMLDKLAKDGHLEIHVGGGGIFYALWEAENRVAEITDGNHPL